MADNKSSLGGLEETLELYFVKKAPFQLPPNVKEALVKFAPWITIIFMIIAIPPILLVLGLGALVAPFSVFMGPAGAIRYGTNYVISMIVLAVSIILELMAIPGLFARSIRGWRLVYWSTLISLISSLLTFNVLNAILTAVISLYILFQIKSYYK